MPDLIRHPVFCWIPACAAMTNFGYLSAGVIIAGRTAGEYTPTLQKPEGFIDKASEGEVVVFYFEPSATQDLKSSGFPEG